MKTVLSILFLLTFLDAATTVFILPKQHNDALNHLSKHLNQATSSVTIISTKIDSYTLKKAILSLLKKRSFNYSNHHISS